MQPNYSPNTVNQTVDYGGKKWRGQPGGGWEDVTFERDRDQAAATLAQQKADTLALNQAQEAKQNDFLSRFRTAIGAQETIPNMASRIGGELNLPALNQTASSAIQNLAQMPKVQTDATRGFNVNSNQLARIISAKQAKLAPVAQQAVTQQQEGERQLGTRLGFETAQQQKELTPFTTEQSMMSEQLAREMTSFSQDKQNALNLVMQQISNGQQLTMQQLQNANELAKLKIASDEAAKQIQGSFQTIGGNALLINPQTGAIMQNYGTAAAPKPLTGTSTKSYNPAGL